MIRNGPEDFAWLQWKYKVQSDIIHILRGIDASRCGKRDLSAGEEGLSIVRWPTSIIGRIRWKCAQYTNVTINIIPVHFLSEELFVNVKLIRDNFYCGS